MLCETRDSGLFYEKLKTFLAFIIATRHRNHALCLEKLTTDSMTICGGALYYYCKLVLYTCTLRKSQGLSILNSCSLVRMESARDGLQIRASQGLQYFLELCLLGYFNYIFGFSFNKFHHTSFVIDVSVVVL